MKILREQILIDCGSSSSSVEYKDIRNQILEAIRRIEWPPGSGSFTLFKQSGKKRGEGSGVVPIKRDCVAYLRSAGWDLETRLDIATLKVPGPIDATRRIKNRLFCFEWETGNISSSHRALNKLAFGMQRNILIGGTLVLPMRSMAQYLTDRVGNFEELEPYFPFWQSIQVRDGILSVIGIEHDGLSLNVPRIPKGTDGRADG